MLKNKIQKYQALNDLAEQNGIVIFGGTEDSQIPLCELKQAFALHSNLYNRSIADLSVNTALEVYDACVASLHPETVLLHIGAADLTFFKEDPSAFEQKYRELISHIRTLHQKCSIAIISLKNYEQADTVSKMNQCLKYIAESEGCEYGDISSKRIWNPKSTKDAVSFVYSIGFVHPLTNRHPVFDLVKILYCCEPQYMN